MRAAFTPSVRRALRAGAFIALAALGAARPVAAQTAGTFDATAVRTAYLVELDSLQSKFLQLAEAFPAIGDHEVTILMHNDAVVQGLSEIPFMQDVKRWGALTIGTGLGNARFTNRSGNGGKENGGKENKENNKE